ncbi:MAG: hypothetical protein ABFD96_11310 [Armatimonadia bacterium]
MDLLTTNNTKVLKGTGRGYMTFILHLAPADSSGREVCPKRSAGCTAACLNTAGRGKMHKVQAGRLRKTRWYHEDRAGFMAQLVWDIRAGIRKADREGVTPVFRLNGTSDIPWERVRVSGENVFEMFPNVQFYDYTKILGRKVGQYANYHLTFSRSETNDRDVARAILQGMNVAVVFDHLPETYLGRPVINADLDDLRFLDPPNTIAGLVAKGRARREDTGFVVRS